MLARDGQPTADGCLPREVSACLGERPGNGRSIETGRGTENQKLASLFFAWLLLETNKGGSIARDAIS